MEQILLSVAAGVGAVIAVAIVAAVVRRHRRREIRPMGWDQPSIEEGRLLRAVGPGRMASAGRWEGVVERAEQVPVQQDCPQCSPSRAAGLVSCAGCGRALRQPAGVR